MEDFAHFVASWWWIWLLGHLAFAFLNGHAIAHYSGGRSAPSGDELDKMSLGDVARHSASRGIENAARAIELEKAGKRVGTWTLFTRYAARTCIALFVAGSILAVSGY